MRTADPNLQLNPDLSRQSASMPAPMISDPQVGGAFHTPLRYPGGKGRLGPWLAQVMRHNRISGGWYVEPYAGGAGAALFLLMQGYVDHIVINDADPVVHAFWWAATQHTKALVDKIQTTPVSIRTWELQREIIARPAAASLVDVAFACFYLNRTNRSGILSAGVIGGKNQDGPYKMDARYNVADLISRIERVGAMSKHITVLKLDALDLLRDATPGFPTRTLVYLDPPYFVKGSQLYRNYYDPDDHAAIASCVSLAPYPVIVTYDDRPEIRALYSELRSCTFSLHYSTHTARPKTSEVLFYKNLELPFDPQMTKGYHLAQQARTNGAIESQKVLSV